MGVFDNIRRVSGQRPGSSVSPSPVKRIVGASSGQEVQLFEPYSNMNNVYPAQITGYVKGYDYKLLLANKEANIKKFFELADYYKDADPIVHGIVYHIYQPYLTDDWFLEAGNVKTKDFYGEYYKKIRLRERLQSWAAE